MSMSMGPAFLNDASMGTFTTHDSRELLETLTKSAATSTTASGDTCMLMEPASKKQKLQSEDSSAVDALLRAGRKKPPWTPTEQAVVAIKHCELGNRWTQIAAYLPLRSENDVKNIWHSTLRCKDTQKRSFLRTYALAVHDHAYDYPTRKAMFDIAVRTCGPPPPQAAEMIARVQMLMDHPELQAAVQSQGPQNPSSMQSLEQIAQYPHDQLSQLTQLLNNKREDPPHHHQLAQIAQLQHQHPQSLAFLGGNNASSADGSDPQDDSVKAPSTSNAKLRTSRDKFGGSDSYAGEPGGLHQNYGGDGTAASDLLLERSGSLQQKHQLQLQQLLSQGGQAALRHHQMDPLDAGCFSQQQRGQGHTESGVSGVARRSGFNGAGGSGDGGSAGGSGGSFATTPADSLPMALAHIAAAAGGDSQAALGQLSALAAAADAPQAGGEGPSAGPRMPGGGQLPGLGSLLALLYKYNIEQVQGASGSGSGQACGGEGGAGEGGDGGLTAAAAAAVAAAAGLDGPMAAAAVAAAAAAAGAGASAGPTESNQGDERRSPAKQGQPCAGPTPPQSLALLLRPLQQAGGSKRDLEAPAAKGNEGDVEAGAGEEGHVGAAGEPVDGDSPRRQASSASARTTTASGHGNGAVGASGTKRPHAAISAPGQQQQQQQQLAPPLRQRSSMGPYNLEDADADELGAVEALALAARMNTQQQGNGNGNGNGRHGNGNGGAGAAAASPGGGGNGPSSGNGGGRISATSNAAATAAAVGGLVSLRNSSGPPPPAPPGPPRPTGGSGTLPLAPGGQSGPVLDLLNRPNGPPSQLSMPAPPTQLPPRGGPLAHLRSQGSGQADAYLPGSQPHALSHPLQPTQRQLPSQMMMQQQQQQQQNNNNNGSNGSNGQGGGGGRLGPYLDVVSVLNMPSLRRQVLALPANTLVALLGSPLFGSDSEASVFVLVALWLQANSDTVTLEQIRKLCGAVRVSALGGFYTSAVLPLVLTEPRVAGKPPLVAPSTAPGAVSVRPGSRWFEMRSEEVAFLTRYANAGSVERALLADVAQNVYDCTTPWYDMTPRSIGMPSEGFCFEWHIPKQGLRDALINSAQPHATFSVREDADSEEAAAAAAADGTTPAGVAIVPYIICRGLEWHVFVDCQQRPGGAVAAGVFVYCRVPGVLRPPPGGSSVVGVVPGAGIRLGVHGWRCGRLEEVFVWTFGDETYFVPDAGMGCPSALPLRKRPISPPGAPSGGLMGRGAGGSNAALEDSMAPWADYLHDGGLRGTLTFLPP